MLNPPLILSLLVIFFISFGADGNTQLLLVNNCKQIIWPGILGNAGHETPENGGFRLPVGHRAALNLPERWSGRIWARQGCPFNDNGEGRGPCQTGDCAGLLRCAGTSGAPPATLVEMTMGTATNDDHYYDVSLVDGFNVPVSMVPTGHSTGDCGPAACERDLNAMCPKNLAVTLHGKVVGCKSACLATKNPKYCCTGEFSDKNVCKPSIFSEMFKNVCPRAYSYAYDESAGLKMYRAPRYVITFCP
ncbi:unnamed protein product [Cuscuta campestris]|uniref:Thaumatin-like protein n=1 Tax=Cuscuta campestris TaxID=132261 RepID=A0A484NEB8_9ASTE|nr:unnamed protein product [Cuscuta campestris]